MRVKENMLGEFNEARQLKASLAKYSIEFNELAVKMRPHRIAYLRLLGRPYTLLYDRRSVGRIDFKLSFFFLFLFLFLHTIGKQKKTFLANHMKVTA